ncbi:3-dehydroquinate synthase [Bacillus sp. AFS041924]|uniref:3-dehydroquinate synthase n=1 Tax=Bacillus sp. AFS041924 TaxID=2033503 RepID=UPI000BFB8300|nr:3-dehydroquinate synthase [Bacillus sp. AFS041924]PGS48879.1 3-dehydroquinate synthase [Bacillus sp. AFS041924]
MNVITVKTSSKQYDVCIGYGVLSHLQSMLDNLVPKVSKILIITDDQVAPIYLEKVKQNCNEANKVEEFIIPNGEKSKSFAVYEDCLTYCFDVQLDRNSLIIALGGGVVGDLAGFVAASYMRGIRFIQLPTTLLAHDSAIGGKVAINLPKAKNIVGAFYQPELVLYELSFLSTLPIAEWRSGFAEISKEAMISSTDNLNWLMNRIHSLEKLEDEFVEKCVTIGISVKNKIVSKDEKENGERAFLNLGHTLGHAIEAYLGYAKTTHGEAIAFGTLFSIYLSEQFFDIDLKFDEILKWYNQLDYPVYSNLELETIVHLMKQDKKNIDLKIKYILLKNYGNPVIVELEEDFIKENLDRFIKQIIS